MDAVGYRIRRSRALYFCIWQRYFLAWHTQRGILFASMDDVPKDEHMAR